MGISMSKKSKESTEAIEPFVSEYDVYAGIYRAHPPRIEVGKDSFPIGDALEAKFTDGMEVIVGGRCCYASVADSQNCGRLPVSMAVKTCVPR